MHLVESKHNLRNLDFSFLKIGKVVMDRFEAMATLVAVVEQGSLSAAGRVLSVPVTTVSRRISDLEALLGTRLLTRTTRKLTLTDAGVAYVEGGASSGRLKKPNAKQRASF